MKSSMFMIVVLIAISNLAFGQQINTGGTGNTPGGKCKILSGPNSGKSGTYDGGGWCCTGANGGGDCTECVDSDGKANGKCADALTKPIKPRFTLNGNWSVAMADKTSKPGVVAVDNNTLSVNINSRTAATGILIDPSTIRITYSDKKAALFGKIASAKRIEWSDGTVWTKK